MKWYRARSRNVRAPTDDWYENSTSTVFFKIIVRCPKVLSWQVQVKICVGSVQYPLLGYWVDGGVEIGLKTSSCHIRSYLLDLGAFVSHHLALKIRSTFGAAVRGLICA